MTDYEFDSKFLALRSRVHDQQEAHQNAGTHPGPLAEVMGAYIDALEARLAEFTGRDLQQDMEIFQKARYMHDRSRARQRAAAAEGGQA